MTAPLAPSPDQVRAELNRIGDPCSVANGTPMGLSEMGLIEQVAIDDTTVAVRLRLTSPSCMMGGYFRARIEEQLTGIAAGRAVVVTHDLGFDWLPELIEPAAAQRRAAVLRARGLPVPAGPGGS